jgi:hypothetical protein
VHEQRARRDQPRDRTGEREYRHHSRREKAKVVGSLLFGRWAEDGNREAARRQ